MDAHPEEIVTAAITLAGQERLRLAQQLIGVYRRPLCQGTQSCPFIKWSTLSTLPDRITFNRGYRGA